MALLFADSSNTFKSGLTLELEYHLDPSKTSSSKSAASVGDSAASVTQSSGSDGVVVTTPSTAGSKTYDGTSYRLRGVKKTSTVDDYLTKLRNISESLVALDYHISDDGHIQAIIDGLDEEYHGFVASLMARFGTFTVPEAEPFLQAYDEMLARSKNLGPSIPVAYFTQVESFNSFSMRGGGRRGRREKRI
ncbi:hypothetical protein PIB30_019801 [Stylosanthes scabra]|uniref:Uncharacterized protein n=1 Tax=Stylosanthes scabra TaxID=79078 RepID=A0ABU6Z554_9FABA|nr:hypothetical protein [Stylosanthes scabra]